MLLGDVGEWAPRWREGRVPPTDGRGYEEVYGVPTSSRDVSRDNRGLTRHVYPRRLRRLCENYLDRAGETRPHPSLVPAPEGLSSRETPHDGRRRYKYGRRGDLSLVDHRGHEEGEVEVPGRCT